MQLRVRVVRVVLCGVWCVWCVWCVYASRKSGEIALLNSVPRQATVKAVGATTLLVRTSRKHD